MRRPHFMTPHGISLLLTHVWPHIEQLTRHIAADLEPEDSKEMLSTLAALEWKLQRLQGKPKTESEEQ